MIKKISRKIAALMMTFAMVLSLMPTLMLTASAVWSGGTATCYAGGTGTASDPYLIETGEQLAYMASVINSSIADAPSLSAYYKLVADIDLNNQPWSPISTGSAYNEKFSGTFDGNGHIISNIAIGTAATPNTTCGGAGLFNVVFGATIKNVGIVNSNIFVDYCNGYGGALVAVTTGDATHTTSITNCYATGNITNSNTGCNVGGLIGFLTYSTLTKCYTAGSVSGGSDAVVGGLVGQCDGSTITSCYSTASASAGAGTLPCAGGLVGWMSTSVSKVLNCYATGNVVCGIATYTGGLVGDYADGTITSGYYNSSATQTVSGAAQTAKGAGDQADPTTPKTSADMKDVGFVDLLNTGYSGTWTADTGANQGYPVLSGVASVVPSLYKITYNGNSNTGGVIPTDTGAYPSGTSVTLAANTGALVRDGYTFDGWSTNSGGTGDSCAVCAGYAITGNVTLYAKWTSTSSAPIVSITTTAANPTNLAAIPVTITFNKDVTGFEIGDITVTNGSKSNFVQVNAQKYTVDIAPNITTGTVTVGVGANVAVDGISQGNTAATTLSFTYDNVAPTVTISSSAGTATKYSPISLVINFSEGVTGFADSDISVTNGTVIPGSLSGSVAGYTVSITPSGQGEVTVNVGAGAAQDLAGNGNIAATQFSITYDSVSPTATITAASTAGGDALVNIAEKAAGFNVVAQSSKATGTLYVVPSGTANNIGAITGAAIGSAASAGANTDTTIAISANNAGVTDATSYMVYAIDAVGNVSTISGVAFTAELVAPTATMTAGTTAGGDALINPIEKAAGFNVVAQSSEATGTLYVVPSGTANNIGAITGAAIGSAASAGANTDTTIAIAANNAGVTDGTSYKVYAVDAAGNISTISGVAFTAELAAPTATVTAGTTAGGDAIVNIAEKAAGFNVVVQSSKATGILYVVPSGTVNNIGAITGAAIGSAASAGANSDTTIAITANNAGVSNGTSYRVYAVDVAGNVSDISGIAYTAELAAPTATIVVSDTNLAAGETSVVTITFSEVVTGFTNADLTVANGTLSAVSSSDGGKTWTATFTPTTNIADTTNVITLDQTAIADAAGNEGSGTVVSNNYAIDTRAPSATIEVGDTALKIGETATVTITFSEAVTGFANADLTVANGTLSDVTTSVSGTTWTATFTPVADIEDTTNIITLNQAGVTNGVGNAGAGTAISNNYAIDTKRPTATIEISDDALKIGEAATVTITFSEAVTGLTSSDFTVKNGTLSTVSSADGGVTWTATLTPSTDIEDTVNIITLDQIGVSDVSGNAGSGTVDSNNYAIDTVHPTVTSVAVPSNGKYMLGSKLEFGVTFNESITVTGTPQISFVIGSTTVYADYSAVGSSPTLLKFTYTVLPTQTDSDGITVGVLSLNGGTIIDAAGNDANLTLNSVGSTANILVDTTAPTVGNGGTIAVSNLTSNSAKLTWTAATDSGTLPTNLQYKAIYSTSNITTVEAADALSGTWTSNITTATVTGLTASTDYYFNVLVKDEAGNRALYSIAAGKTTAAPSGGGGGASSSTPASTSTVVEVNGQKQDAGTANTQTTGGQTVTTITVDDTKLNKILESKGENPTVSLPTNTTSGVVVGQLNGQTVKNMEAKEAVLEIKTGNVSYTLPASQINIDAVSSQIGSQVELKDIKVSVKIAEPSANTVKVVEDTAKKNSYKIVVKPMEFEISCTSGSKTVEVSKFNGYVERTVAIPDGVDPSKITTGIVLNSDGSFSHVPTQIVKVDGKYFAKINSLTNSTYSVIYNPVTFTDVANHWSKDAGNDMGSRMVVTGMGNGTYEPDRSITRAEFAAIVVRAMGLQKGTTESAFGDVTLADWYNGYVSTATAYCLITGYDSNSYGPNDTITREQAMAIIARAMQVAKLEVVVSESEMKDLLAKYSDGTAASDYAKKSVAQCLKSGIVNGTSSTTISPKDPVTRAEVAVMVQHLLQKSNLINK